MVCKLCIWARKAVCFQRSFGGNFFFHFVSVFFSSFNYSVLLRDTDTTTNVAWCLFLAFSTAAINEQSGFSTTAACIVAQMCSWNKFRFSFFVTRRRSAGLVTVSMFICLISTARDYFFLCWKRWSGRNCSVCLSRHSSTAAVAYDRRVVPAIRSLNDISPSVPAFLAVGVLDGTYDTTAEQSWVVSRYCISNCNVIRFFFQVIVTVT